MRRWICSTTLVMLLLCVCVAVTQAKGRPDKLTISGPGLKGMVEVTDPQSLDGLDLGDFVVYDAISAPRAGDGYELTAFYQEDQQYHVSLSLHYYLNPTGGSGFVNYADSDGTDYDHSRIGKWYCAAPFADDAVRNLLQKLGVAVAKASTLRAPEQFTLKGPGISGEAPLNDKVSLTGLSADELVHWTWGPLAPPKVANGYELTHYVQNCVGQMVVDTRLRYYAGSDGRPGYIYLVAGSERDPLRDVTNWFLTTPQGENRLRALVTNWQAPTPAVPSAILLDQPLPASLRVNQPISVGFRILPSRAGAYLPPTLIVYAQHIDEESNRDVFPAKADGAPGHYQVTLNFNRGGIWYWLINAETAAGEQPMPMLTVADRSSTQSNSPNTSGETSASPIALTLLLLTLIVVAGLWMGRRSPVA